jgi:hypothetical protein
LVFKKTEEPRVPYISDITKKSQILTFWLDFEVLVCRPCLWGLKMEIRHELELY